MGNYLDHYQKHYASNELVYKRANYLVTKQYNIWVTI